MRKRDSLLLTILTVILMVSFLPAASAENQLSTAVIDGIDASRVHLRAEPDQSAASMGLFFTGTEVCLLDMSDQHWAQVEIGSQRGYMMKKYLRFGADPELVTSRQPLGVLGNGYTEAPVWYTLPPDAVPDGSINEVAVLTLLGETADGFYYAQASGLHFYVSADAIWVTESDAPPPAKASRLFWQVVCNQRVYVDARSGQSLYLSQYTPDLDEASYVIGRYAVADLDRDEEMEVAVEVLVEGFPYCYLLLDERDGEVYAYEETARGLLELKVDGTARWANGAGNHGFGWRGYWNGDPAAGTIALCDTTGEQLIYVVDGEPTTEEAFREAEWQQHIKPDAVWYWPGVDQLNLLFE